MSRSAPSTATKGSGFRGALPGYGWVVVFVSALAMTATLPGRTHGLGLITEPLIKSVGIEHTLFARINLVTCLLGTAFCIPVGYCLDRFGTRLTLSAVVAALGLSVVGMSAVAVPLSLFASLLLVRGLGQSALSVVSMAAIGKWFRRRLGVAMGVYAVLLTFGFIGSVLWLGRAVQDHGWRNAWFELGMALAVGLAPLSWFLIWREPDNAQDSDDESDLEQPDGQRGPDFTLVHTLATPAFWAFALGTAMFNLVWSGLTLFNESILAERGFEPSSAVKVMAILTGTGLLSNLIAGALTKRERIGWLLGCGLGILAVSLAFFPHVSTTAQLYGYAAALGTTGGLITVVFFASWGQVFGRSHLGRIQGAAQLISTFASAIGPVFMAECEAATGSYSPIFYALAAATGGLAVWAIFVRIPSLEIAAQSSSVPAATLAKPLPVTQES